MSNNTIINVYVVLSPQSLSYYNYLVKNYTELARHPERIKFITVGNADVPNSDLLVRVDKMIIVPMDSSKSSSTYHALMLNAALQDVDIVASEVNVFADSDTVMLQYGWDDIISDVLRKCDIAGGAYEDVGGYSTGSGKLQTYKMLPSGVWFAVHTMNGIDWSKLDMSQGEIKSIPIDTDELSRLYNLPVGYEMFSKEMGWRIPQFIHDHKLKCTTLVQRKPTKDAKIVRTNNDYHEEYWLPDGTPIIAHQRGSRQHVFRSVPFSGPFYDACEAHINMLRRI
jgi:hypothetical protein